MDFVAPSSSLLHVRPVQHTVPVRYNSHGIADVGWGDRARSGEGPGSSTRPSVRPPQEGHSLSRTAASSRYSSYLRHSVGYLHAFKPPTIPKTHPQAKKRVAIDEAIRRHTAPGGPVATTGLEKGEQVKLFYWPEDEAAVSWAVASSALFSPFAKASEVSANGVPMRPYLTEHKVATWAGGEQMIYTGQVLAQSDHDVWMELMRLAVEQNGHDLIFNENPNTTPIDDRPSVPVRFSGLEMLRLLGRANHGKEHSRLGESLFRLSTSVLDFKVERGGVELSSSGAMLQAVRRLGEKKKRRTKKKDGTVMMVDVETGDYQVWISMDCVRLWGTGATTFKKALREGLSPTAQWLHLFVLRQDCREGPAARFVSESKLFRVMGVHLAHADNGAQSSLSSQRKARENRRNKVAKAMTELAENGVLTAVGKKRRNKNGRLVYAWWFSKRGASGDIIYSLGFIPAPGQQLTLPGL